MALTTSAYQILRTAGVDAPLPAEYWDLVERYREGLLEQALAILGNRADAEDAVQETFVEAARNPEKLAQAQSLGAWLGSVNRANALNRLRSNKRASESARLRRRELPEDAFTTGGFSALELRESMAKAIESLSPKLREAVELRFFQHLAYKEIAKKLSIEPGAVQQRLLQASEQLYEKLKTRLDEQTSPPRPEKP